MIRDEFQRKYWRYYLVLEKRFMATTDYLELDPDNHKAFSNEFAALLQAIGAELDAFFKVYCDFCPEEHKNIGDYAKSILSSYPDIVNQRVVVTETDIVLTPFLGWTQEKAKQTLVWWEAFDAIKHNRAGNKERASQNNVLNALAALFLLERKYLSNLAGETGELEIDIPDISSTLFGLPDWESRYIPSNITMLKILKKDEPRIT